MSTFMIHFPSKLLIFVETISRKPLSIRFMHELSSKLIKMIKHIVQSK